MNRTLPSTTLIDSYLPLGGYRTMLNVAGARVVSSWGLDRWQARRDRTVRVCNFLRVSFTAVAADSAEVGSSGVVTGAVLGGEPGAVVGVMSVGRRWESRLVAPGGMMPGSLSAPPDFAMVDTVVPVRSAAELGRADPR